jgi:hypothetical protein
MRVKRHSIPIHLQTLQYPSFVFFFTISTTKRNLFTIKSIFKNLMISPYISWDFFLFMLPSKIGRIFWWQFNQNYFGLHETKSTNILMKKTHYFVHCISTTILEHAQKAALHWRASMNILTHTKVQCQFLSHSSQ